MIPTSAFSRLSSIALTCIFNSTTYYTLSSLTWSNPILFHCHTFTVLLLTSALMYTCAHTHVCTHAHMLWELECLGSVIVSYWERCQIFLHDINQFFSVFQFYGQWYLETTLWVLRVLIITVYIVKRMCLILLYMLEFLSPFKDSSPLTFSFPCCCWEVNCQIVVPLSFLFGCF